VGLDPRSGQAWLAHCYGAVGVGRDLAPDTGTGGELYAVIGHAPRHLDRNIATVGRVVEGMDLLTSRRRGTEALGFIKDPKQHIPIARIRLAADLPARERPALQVLRTDTPTFSAYVLGRANRGGTFFNVPAGGVDLVQRQRAGATAALSNSSSLCVGPGLTRARASSPLQQASPAPGQVRDDRASAK
jgi:peptidylprolyl isomerase